MYSMNVYEAPAKPLYDSSALTTIRLARSRSASLSSTGSLYDSSSSSTSSSLSSLESSEIQEIFKRMENVTITDKTLSPPPQVSAVQLELAFRPTALRNQRRLTLNSEGKLDPKAVPFVPGPSASRNAQTRSSTGPPTHDGSNTGSSLGAPPGLLMPSGSVAGETHLTDPPNASPVDPFDAYYDPAPPPPIHWWFYLEAGTSHDATADDLIRESNAVAAVTSNEHWSDEEMFFFASHFPGKVYSSVHSQEYPVAPFALSVYQAFETQKDILTAQRFLMALRQHSMNAFMNSWSKESFNPELHAHLESGLSGHIFASLYLAKFVGDLFNVGLLSKDHVKACISKLLEGPHCEEHIVALGHLVVQAGPEFWMSEPMVLDAKEFEDFMQKFEKAATYARGSLIEYNEQPSGYSARWVDFVREHFFSWEATMAEYSC